MIFNNKNVITYLVASVATLTVAANSETTARDLTVCDTLKACFLVNIQTRKEIELSGKDSFELDPLNKHGYSIRCDVNGDASLDFIKFSYDGMVQDEFGKPRYMDGDSDAGKYINDVKYLATCGTKKLKIEGSVWSNSCFTKEFLIDVRNAGGKPCTSGDTVAPIKSPTAAPVKPPTNAPVKPPTNAPVKPPTNAPVKPPTNAPVKPPTNAPVKPPTNAPVKPPTNAPVKTPTNAPVKPPTRAPVKSPTNAPMKPPARAPVKPPTHAPIKPPTRAPVKLPTRAPIRPPVTVCPYPKVLVNGECKDVCKTDYHCPSNSIRKPNMACYDGFEDCECTNGFVKASHDDKCWCPSPKIVVNGYCKDNSCKNDYVCPANSYRKPSRDCYDSFDDCECKHGYYKSSHENKCLRHIWCTW